MIVRKKSKTKKINVKPGTASPIELDLGLDIYRIEYVDGEHTSFYGKIDHDKKTIFMTKQNSAQQAETFVHEITHYCDDKFAGTSLCKSDPGANGEHHPSLDRFAKGLTNIMIRNWPLWRVIFDQAWMDATKN